MFYVFKYNFRKLEFKWLINLLVTNKIHFYSVYNFIAQKHFSFENRRKLMVFVKWINTS